MDPVSAFVRNVTFPLWMWRDGDWPLVRLRGTFDELDGSTPDQVRARQLRGLRAILVHARDNTEYYRRIFAEAGFDPTRIGDVAALSALPLLTKQLVRENFEALRAANLPDTEVRAASTGGSTGVAMRFLRDRQCLRLRKAQEWYFDRWLGYRIGDPVALFVSASHYHGVADRLKARVRNATCERMLSFDPHENSDEYLGRFARRYARFRPRMVKCFPNSLAVFADFVQRNGIALPPVRAIACAGENLYGQQRRMFESVFGGEVFDKYGTRESGVIAGECAEHRGLHVFTDGAVVEVLATDGSPAGVGESGRVVVTDLFNRAMPLIRYEIGDMAVVGPRQTCSCGSPLPRLEKILGRDRDIIIDSAGRPRVGYLFVEVVKNLAVASQFQIVQPERSRLLVRMVDAHPTDAALETLRQRFLEIMGQDVEIRFEHVDSISRDPSGKYRYVVSELTRWTD